MKAQEQEDWNPASGLDLEANAMKVVRSPTGNFLVVAGPGAGKTELLAQRACFLLQTNTCRYPHRILAISFKRDAAYNLKERVKLRAGSELSNRFDSMTYDSFAKHVLDRFRSALPDEYKIPTQYEVCWDDDIIDLYRNESEEFVNTNNKNGIISFHSEVPLPYVPKNLTEKMRLRVWQQALKKGKLTFHMIMRLSDLIIGTNPKIESYLHKTYRYVFLDEFQDTTIIQYDFLKTCFYSGDAILTAVGDDKQRIMLWAGARKTVFEDFQKDYGAERIPLKMNFRSAPILVKVQNSLIKTLLNKTDFAIPSSKWKDDDGECIIWEFENQTTETKHLVETIPKWISEENLRPREICILVKGSLTKYVSELIESLNANGISARDESLFQDFLTDEVILYIIHCMYMVFGVKNNLSKGIVFEFLSKVNNELSDQQLMKLEHRLSWFIKQLQKEFKKKTTTSEEIIELIRKVVQYANPDRIRAIFGVYRQAAYLNKVISDFEKTFVAYSDSSKNLTEALDRFCGVDTIPVMTVHKSKGLEYHTVLFVGLEDGAFWSYSSQPDEDKSTFFVALSRAKERVVFTFSKIRDGLKRPVQSRKSIAVIFEEMKKAGVPIQVIKS